MDRAECTIRSRQHAGSCNFCQHATRDDLVAVVESSDSSGGIVARFCADCAAYVADNLARFGQTARARKEFT